MKFFGKFFATINPLEPFIIQSWIPSLSQPSIPCDLSPPTHKEITTIIRRIKASSSPCPLDKIPIILYKESIYLRSFSTETIHDVWMSGEVPQQWNSAYTIMIHKKRDTSEPTNYRPITLEIVPLKTLTSCIMDSMFTFLSFKKDFFPNCQVPSKNCTNSQYH